MFVYGQDCYRSRQHLQQLKEKFLREVDASGYNLISMDGKNMTFELFHSHVMTVSLFAKRRMVIVENFISENGQKKEQERIMNFLEKHNDQDAIIVFYEGKEAGDKKRSAKKENTLFVFLKKQKFTFHFPILQGYALKAWIQNRFAQSGLNVESHALETLSRIPSMGMLASECEKLRHYAEALHAKSISKSMISDICPETSESDIFAMVDALSASNSKKALRFMEYQLEEGENEMYLLTMIARQFRILAQTKQGVMERKTSDEISKLLGMPRFVIQKTIAQCEKFSFERLSDDAEKILNLEVALKSSAGNAKVLFTKLLLEL